MKIFITSYMDKLDRANDGQIQQLEHDFTEACRVVRRELGDRPFHLRQRLNLAALDAVMACAVEFAEPTATNISAAYQNLRSEPDFMETVTYNTSDTAVVHHRLEFVRTAVGA